MKQAFIAFAMVAALTVGVAVAQSADEGTKAGRHGHFGRHGGRAEFGRMGFRQLDLSDAQKAQLKQIHQSHREALAPLMQQLRAKRQELRAANESGTINEAALTQKLQEIAPLEARLMAEHARIRQESLGVLTAEQKAKLDQLREQAKTRWAERRANKQVNKQ